MPNGSGDPNGHVPRPFVNGNGHLPHVNGFRKNTSPEQTGHLNGFGHNGRLGHQHQSPHPSHHNGTNGFRVEKVNGVNGGGRNGHMIPSPVREVVLTPADFPSLKGSTDPTPAPTTPCTPNGLGGLTAAQVLKGNAARAKLNGDVKTADEVHIQEAMARVTLDGSDGGKVRVFRLFWFALCQG